MNERSVADGAVFRKASKATAVLQVLAVMLLAVLAIVYSDISARYSSLQDGVRENAMWSVYQLDREARRLDQELAVLLARDGMSKEGLKTISTRYDILYSRMKMLDTGQFEDNFKLDTKDDQRIHAVRDTIYDSMGIFDRIVAGESVSSEELRALSSRFAVLVDHTQNLVTLTNTILSSDRTDKRNEILDLERNSAYLIAFLFVIVAALILTLRRQLKSVRAAGLSLETMACDLTLAYQGAEAGNRAKSQFMATMGHEIRTPLNAILGMVELMELKPLTSECSGNLRTIRKSGEALLDIINEILDFSKIEHGKLELEKRVIDVVALAESAVEMMRGRSSETGNQVKLQLAQPMLAPYIVSDPTRLRQVVLNLMSNAIKFTSQGIITLEIGQEHRRDGLHLRVAVHDTGIGIDDNGKAKLFQPFSQVDASISRKYGGTGLGLTICKEIVERFGGVMGVDSQLGIGSTFWFEIPVEASETAPVAKPISTAVARALPTYEILVVEDNKVNLQVATKFLEHLKQKVWVAENGEIGAEVARSRRFDLILMDMQMPVMDGIELTTLIRAEGLSSKTPIIAMTANASEEDRRKCLEAGMDGFQSKPISIPQLRLILEGLAEPGQVAAPQDEASVEVATADEEPLLSADFHQRRLEMVDALGEEIFEELLDTFFKDAVAVIDNLRDIDGKSAEDIDRELHTLKGAAANMGLNQLASISHAMRGQDIDPAAVEALSIEINKYRQKLAA